MDCPSWWRVIIQTLTMAMQKKCIITYVKPLMWDSTVMMSIWPTNSFLKVQPSGCGHSPDIDANNNVALVAETRQFWSRHICQECMSKIIIFANTKHFCWLSGGAAPKQPVDSRTPKKRYRIIHGSTIYSQ